MANRVFFKNFFNDNKIWKQVQSNPIAHQDLMPDFWPTRIPYLMTDHHGVPITVDYDHNIHFYGAGNPAHRVRFPAARAGRAYTLSDEDLSNQDYKKIGGVLQAKNYIIDKFGDRPAVGVALGNPIADWDAYGPDNRNALMYKGYFKPQEFSYHTGGYRWRKKKDYWLPFYEGNFNEIPEKQSKRKSFYYDKDMKFLPSQFFKPKQKEAMVWLNSDFT